MKVVTYYADSGTLRDHRVYALAHSLVSQSRKEKTDRFVFDKDRRLSLGVELLLMTALDSLGEDPEKFEIEYTGNGKPMLKGSDIFFNLSHSEERVMCSICDSDVGCDVEMIRPINLDIARKHFFGTEYDAIAEEDGDDGRYEMFYRFWTLKESFMKVTGLGFELPLDSFRITLGDPITVEQSVDGRDYRFIEYIPFDGYRCAVCSVGRDFEPEMRYIDLRDVV